MARLRRTRRRRVRAARRARVEPLEPRILLSADLPAAEALALPPAHDAAVVEVASADADAIAPGIEQHALRHEIVFIDPGVEGSEKLVADLRDGAGEGREIEVFRLDGERDGVAQIREILAGRSELVDSIHVVSHGTETGFQLGATWLTAENVAAHAGDLAGWSDALGSGADLLLYGCNLAAGADGQALIEALALLTGGDVAASVDATGAARLGGDWELEYASGAIESRIAFGAAAQATFDGILNGTALWSDNGLTAPETSEFDGLGFGPVGTTADVGSQLRVLAGAEAPTRDEKIVVGLGSDKRLDAMVWDGTAWTSTEPFGIGFIPLASNLNWSVDVAYESQSGDAVLTYSAGGFGLFHSVWDGTSFSIPQSISAPVPGDPVQMKLAADPNSDEMVLVVANEFNETYAFVWDGTSWGPGTHFPSGDASPSVTDVNVVYEQQSGDAMVVFADGSWNAQYRIWDGSSWTGGAMAPPASVGGSLTFTALAADPNSDRIAFGANTENRYVWLSTWDGASWAAPVMASSNAPHSDRQGVAVAFESSSGEAIAAYATGNKKVRYRTWNASGGWSNAAFGPDLGSHPDALTLDADPLSDTVMLSVVDMQKDVTFAAWDGAGWTVQAELETNAGTNKGQPFLFLWDQNASAAVNTAPVLVPGAPSLTAVTEDDVANTGELVSTLVSGSVTDPDGGALEGIAVFGLTSGNGTWQYSLDGVTVWNAVGAVDPSNALLLRDSDRVRFVPDGRNGTLASFDFRAWDQTTGSAGATADVTSNGGTSAFSAASDTASISVSDVNDAPTKLTSTTVVLGPVTEDAGPPVGAVGSLISSLVDFPGGGGLDNVDDVDTGALLGVAVVNAPGSNGIWHYSIDGGASWSPVGAVTPDSALLLAADALTRIYFEPNADFNGTESLKFRAWDQTSGLNGGLGDVTPTGATGAFSTASSFDATVTVTPVNDAPVLDPSGTMTLSDVLQDSPTPPGSSVASIVASAGGDRITDADAGALEGIAVVGVDDANGTWQYSTNGGSTWTSFVAQGVANGAVDDTSAVLLTDSALVRFVPGPAYTGSAGDLSFRAWDRTSGLGGDVGVNVSTNGGITAFSTARETATLNVLPTGGVQNLTPGAQNADEDGSLTFSLANGNSIQVDDGDPGDSLLRTTLTVTNGTLSLAGVAGLTFESGANGSATMTFSGLESAINAALDGMSYAPTSDYNGPATLQVTTSLSEAGLQALYSFDNGGDPGNDDGPVGTFDGSLLGGVTSSFDPTRGDNVLDFDGVNGAVQIPGRFGLPASVTLAAWVNLDAGFSDDEVISIGNDVALRLDDTIAGNGVTGFFWDGSSFQHTDSNVFVSGTGWHHVAFTFDDANDLQTIYVDGVAGTPSTLSQSIAYDFGTDTYLGRNGSGPSKFLHGMLDDARIYDRALSAGEVRALAQDQPSDASLVAISVAAVNDAPTGLDATVVTDEDVSYAFTLADFGFTDPVEGDAILGVVITTAPGAGTLRNGLDVIAGGEFVSAAAISAGALVFTPAPDANGASYSSFGFQVRDAGGTANGGIDTDPTANLMTIDVAAVNDAPSGTDATVSTPEDTTYAFGLGDFGFSDAADGHGLGGVVIDTIPGAGTLRDGALVLAGGETVSAASIVAGGLTFTPASNASGAGYASFTFRVQDDGGTANGGTDLDPVANTLTIDVTPANDAPSLNPLGPSLTAIDEDALANGGDLVSDLLAGSITDPDAGAQQGIAITSVAPGNGSFEYSLDAGATWTAVPAVADANALLLRDSDRVRFVPNGQNGTTASFDYRAWDQSAGSAGAQLDTAGGGGASAFSTAIDTASIAVADRNDAPTLAVTTPTLAPIDEDATANLGSQVSSLLGVAMSDVDSVAPEGIAVTSLAGANGSWEFSSDGGSSWNAVGSVSGGSALLLRDADRIRFRPDGANGTLASFGYRAWDQASGVAGSRADASTTGGTTAFSTTSDTAQLVVASLNDAPALGNAALASVSADDASPPGATVAALFGGSFADVDAGASLAGIAIVGNGADPLSECVWQYSSDGVASWAAVGSVADGATALALDPATTLRFVPAAGFSGAPTPLVVRGLDDTHVGAFATTTGGIETRQFADTSANGGQSAVSGATTTLSTAITPGLDLSEVDPPPPAADPNPPGEETTGTDPPADAAPPAEAAPSGSDLAPQPAAPSFGLDGPKGAPSHAAVPEPPTELDSPAAAEPRHEPSRRIEVKRLSFEALRKLVPQDLSFLSSDTGFLHELDGVRDDVGSGDFIEHTVVGSSVALSAGLSIGYVIWLTRGGLLIASLASSMPAWRLIDPIPVLASLAFQGRDDREREESLDSIVREGADGDGAEEAAEETLR